VNRPARVRLLIAMVLCLFAAGCGQAGSIVNPKASEANRIATTWWIIFALACVVYLVVGGLIVFAALRGRRRRGASGLRENAFIWVGGIIVPLVILLVIAGVTVNTTSALRNPSSDALHIDVTGKLWWWDVRYVGTNVVTANTFHIPAGRPIDLRVTSDNVIHSFWVPELAGKEDTIPGQTNHLRFTADEPGTYRGRCAEFCGLQHAHMDIIVVVDTAGDFGRWLARREALDGAPTSDATTRGAVVFQREACAGCHTIRGTSANGKVGPDLSDFGSRPTIGAGVLTNTPEHLHDWIYDAPAAKPGTAMPQFHSLPARDIAAVATYLESLK
jgi:cytochrome c oxidase subunit II